MKRCWYGPSEWDPRGFWIARCPKHPESFAVSIMDSNVTGYHLVADTDSGLSP